MIMYLTYGKRCGKDSYKDIRLYSKHFFVNNYIFIFIFIFIFIVIIAYDIVLDLLQAILHTI
jgi:hypothetical protein